MHILYDLIQSLAKEEKRLYQLHKRDSRFQRIYEAYTKAHPYTKTLDQHIYAEHFSDVSRAFYSMQKRALMDDILVVLLEYSNSQNPGYQFTRLYGRTQVLLQRRMGDAARAFSEEVLESAQATGDSERIAMALRSQQQALLLGSEPSLAEYERLEHELHNLQRPENPERLVDYVHHVLSLLKSNYDNQPRDWVQHKARESMALLSGVAIDPQDLPGQLRHFAVEQMYYHLLDDPSEYHRHLASFYKRAASNGQHVAEEDFYELVNRYLDSGLRAGDFLLLTGMIYKLNKDVDQLRPQTRAAFLPAYLETCSLFSFYENDLPTALKQVDLVIRSNELDHERRQRCVYYRLAMLVAAHLPGQAREEIQYYNQHDQSFANNPLTWLIDVLVHIDAKQNPDETLFLIERYRNQLKRRGGHRAIHEGLNQLAHFAERKKVKERPVQVFPSDWENILRVDLYVRAKQSTSFYYNLVLEDWKARKKVF